MVKVTITFEETNAQITREFVSNVAAVKFAVPPAADGAPRYGSDRSDKRKEFRDAIGGAVPVHVVRRQTRRGA